MKLRSTVHITLNPTRPSEQAELDTTNYSSPPALPGAMPAYKKTRCSDPFDDPWEHSPNVESHKEHPFQQPPTPQEPVSPNTK